MKKFLLGFTLIAVLIGGCQQFRPIECDITYLCAGDGYDPINFNSVEVIQRWIEDRTEPPLRLSLDNLAFQPGFTLPKQSKWVRNGLTYCLKNYSNPDYAYLEVEGFDLHFGQTDPVYQVVELHELGLSDLRLKFSPYLSAAKKDGVRFYNLTGLSNSGKSLSDNRFKAVVQGINQAEELLQVPLCPFQVSQVVLLDEDNGPLPSRGQAIYVCLGKPDEMKQAAFQASLRFWCKQNHDKINQRHLDRLWRDYAMARPKFYKGIMNKLSGNPKGHTLLYEDQKLAWLTALLLTPSSNCLDEYNPGETQLLRNCLNEVFLILHDVQDQIGTPLPITVLLEQFNQTELGFISLP